MTWVLEYFTERVNKYEPDPEALIWANSPGPHMGSFVCLKISEINE